MDNYIYMLGPCSAESREQVLLTARQIKDACSEMPFIYRAGVWKPRTSPRTYQGAGEEGLQWLSAVKTELGIPVATEVAQPAHVLSALEAGIDYLWIGARTSANPLAVEAIRKTLSSLPSAGELKGIFVKNPVNEDAALWLGNIERMEQTGLPVMAIHRGCGHKPCWRMAHELRLARPEIPMLLDPSHMSGDAAQIPQLMLQMDSLALDGAMIEVHCDPAHALSDARQQVLPHDIPSILSMPHGHTDTELQWLRAEIDELDTLLWETIAARMAVSQRIGAYKKAHAIPPLQIDRYRQITQQIQHNATQWGLSPEFAIRLWEAIHEESLNKQR